MALAESVLRCDSGIATAPQEASEVENDFQVDLWSVRGFFFFSLEDKKFYRRGIASEGDASEITTSFSQNVSQYHRFDINECCLVLRCPVYTLIRNGSSEHMEPTNPVPSNENILIKVSDTGLSSLNNLVLVRLVVPTKPWLDNSSQLLLLDLVTHASSTRLYAKVVARPG